LESVGKASYPLSMATRKDYYRILGVSPEATSEELKRAYRKRAFELHPDRNGGTREAEQAFKELTEAYAVLGDPGRRASYDAPSAAGGAPFGGSFDPDDAFRDLFRNQAFADLFGQLASDFAREGLRFDESYLKRFFAGQKGGFLFGGFVVFGPTSRPPFPGTRGRLDVGSREEVGGRRPGLLRRLFRALPGILGSDRGDLDVHFKLPVQPGVLKTGGTVRVTLPGPAGPKTYAVRVPAGSRPGTKLRLSGRGREERGSRGDAYLELRAAEQGAVGR
jgi:DnaJ-class molecular chaperone